MSVIKSDIYMIVKTLTSDRITFHGSEYGALTAMLQTLNTLALEAPAVRETEKEEGISSDADPRGIEPH